MPGYGAGCKPAIPSPSGSRRSPATGRIFALSRCVALRRIALCKAPPPVRCIVHWTRSPPALRRGSLTTRGSLKESPFAAELVVLSLQRLPCVKGNKSDRCQWQGEGGFVGAAVQILRRTLGRRENLGYGKRPQLTASTQRLPCVKGAVSAAD